MNSYFTTSLPRHVIRRMETRFVIGINPFSAVGSQNVPLPKCPSWFRRDILTLGMEIDILISSGGLKPRMHCCISDTNLLTQ